VHVPRARAQGLLVGGLPARDARLLQGAAVPVRRVGDARPRRGDRPEADGRSSTDHAADRRRVLDRRARAGRHSAVRRLLQQGRRARRREPDRARARLGDRAGGCLLLSPVHGAVGVPRVLWRGPDRAARARVAAGDDGPARAARDRRRLRWVPGGQRDARPAPDLPGSRAGQGPRADTGPERPHARRDLGRGGGARDRRRVARLRLRADRLGGPPRPAVEPAPVPRAGLVRRRRVRGGARQPGEGRLRVPRVCGRRAGGRRCRECHRSARAVAGLGRAAGPDGVRAQLRAGHLSRGARAPRLRGVPGLMPWLTITTFLPLAGVAVLLAWRRAPDDGARALALGVSVATFIVSLRVLGRFDGSVGGFQMVEHAVWVRSPRIQYLLGVDGVSLFMVLLTTFLMPIAILASWTVRHRVRLYMAAMLVLETGMIGTFLALDLV